MIQDAGAFQASQVHLIRAGGCLLAAERLQSVTDLLSHVPPWRSLNAPDSAFHGPTACRVVTVLRRGDDAKPESRDSTLEEAAGHAGAVIHSEPSGCGGRGILLYSVPGAQWTPTDSDADGLTYHKFLRRQGTISDAVVDCNVVD